jgi:periplasmic protein TonB
MVFSSSSGDVLEADYRPAPLGGPFAKSALLHLLVIALFLGYAYMHNLFHGSEWGSNSTQEGAIQATLVSSAAVPLPQDHPPTDNVLATETPSAAPDLEQQKTEPIPAPESIPIPEKQPPAKPAPKPRAVPPPQKQPPPPQQHKATFGEAAPANLPRAMTNSQNPNNPVATPGGDFGTRFGYYVDIIRQRVAQNWLLPEVASGTPVGATVYIQFNVGRGGAVSEIQIAKGSGSPSLDLSCLHAVQRVDAFPPLPAGYTQSSLNVLYHCTFPGR